MCIVFLKLDCFIYLFFCPFVYVCVFFSFLGVLIIIDLVYFDSEMFNLLYVCLFFFLP